jgi:hypothetical protein
METSSLPASARLRSERLVQLRDEGRVMRDGKHERMRFLQARSGQLANARDSAGTEAGRKAAVAELARLHAEYERLLQQRNHWDAVLRNRTATYDRCETFVGQLRPGQTLRAVATKAKAFTAEALAQLRQKIAGTLAEIERIAALPLDRAGIERLVTAHVERIGAAVEVRLAGERGDAPFEVIVDSKLGGLHRLTAIEALAWLDPKATTKRLLAAIPVAEGMAAADKAAAIEQLRAELLNAERAEEALVEAALADGNAVERRPDADPRAVLGIAVVKASEQQAA